MNKIPVFGVTICLLIFLVGISCNHKPTNEEPMNETATTLPPITDEFLETAILYEANIRQFTHEGNFDAFAKELPQIKALGVNILWLMPTYPISTTKSKGPLGSYYAVSDYKGVNPEYGTLEDLKALVDQAHDLGMYVIFDWVPAHAFSS